MIDTVQYRKEPPLDIRAQCCSPGLLPGTESSFRSVLQLYRNYTASSDRALEYRMFRSSSIDSINHRSESWCQRGVRGVGTENQVIRDLKRLLISR